MKHRILGLFGGWRRRSLVAGTLAVVAAGLVAMSALAVHDEAFELDGNINENDSAGTGNVDWNNDIVGVGANGFSVAQPQASLPTGFSAATAGPDFTTTIKQGVEVGATADTTTFTTNSKDILDISAQWKCVDANNVTDKGDLVNTYAVAYINAANELILYFGAEKNDASGTNNIGVWFLQDPTVNCDGQGAPGGGRAFTGNHINGDILVVSEFTNGGSTANITAYRWDNTVTNNLVQLGTSGICGAPGTDDRLCAITNSTGALNPPWKTWDKDANTLDTMDTQQFYEGAINVSAFNLNPCISTLLTNTRSSKETTATLYDYSRREFNVCASKKGTKFHDLNANGTRDSGEPALPDWTINLYQDTGTKGTLDGEAVFRTDVTDADGAYSFDNLFSGDYIVCEVKKDGWNQSRPAAGQTLPPGETLVTNCPGDTNGYAFTMGGATREGNDFGNFQPASKSGTKFVDTNGNGQRDGSEPGLAGVNIHLSGTDGAGNAVHEHTTTGPTGAYSFTGIRPGSYQVCETVPAGYTQSYPTGTTVGSTACSDPHSGRGWAITLASGDADTGNDFGNFQNATKSGTKFDDLDADGVRDMLEPGLSGVLFHLFGTSGAGTAVHQHATTDVNGNYSFSVPPGSYTVCETVPAGYTQSFPTSGPSCAGHETASGFGYSITLTSGEIDSGNDFGNFQNATVSGMKFKDADAGGDKDADERGLGGWQIHLFGTAGTGATIHLHTTTASNGSYSFTVPPGSYTLCETVAGQTGWVQSFPVSGADCSGHTGTAGAVGYSVTVASGGSSTGNDFGNTPLSRVVVTFESLADLPEGGDATRATSISCADTNGNGVGSVSNQNSLTTDSVKTNQSSLTCTVTYVDP